MLKQKSKWQKNPFSLDRFTVGGKYVFLKRVGFLLETCVFFPNT